MAMLKLENGLKIFNLTGHEEDQRIAMDHLNLEIDAYKSQSCEGLCHNTD